MNKVMVVVCLAAFAGNSLAEEKGKGAAAPAAAAAPMQPGVTAVAAEDLKWMEAPNTGGVMLATIRGDMKTGPYAALAKFPAGNTHPLHTHTGDIVVVVISGNFMLGTEGGPEKKYGPGSVTLIAGGAKHTSGCDAAGPCVIYQEQTLGFDMAMVAAAPAATAAGKK